MPGNTQIPKLSISFPLEYFFGIILHGLKGQIEVAGDVHTPDDLDTVGLHRLCCAEHLQAVRLVWDGCVSARVLVEGCISGTKSTKLIIKENRGKLLSMLFLAGGSTVARKVHSPFSEAAECK
ncbi:hypothetical protein E2C01_021222 [Portunus trituberculatus]|uniref:Uncharacterized protein n=1 Tax=Portunus trituberculatus TaxID=210409 RepID=A0A5B7E3M5_PORTR|nr:hypothetical protein [Portunus trituberculatus]